MIFFIFLFFFIFCQCTCKAQHSSSPHHDIPMYPVGCNKDSTKAPADVCTHFRRDKSLDQ